MKKKLVDCLVEEIIKDIFSEDSLEYISLPKKKKRKRGRPAKWTKWQRDILYKCKVTAKKGTAKANEEWVYARTIEMFNLNTVEFGGGKFFYINNLKITSRTSKLELKLETSTLESKTDNNVLELEFA